MSHAQDIHLSQFFASPITLNPALTGVVNGDYRIGFNFRDQWGSFTPFTTYSAFLDAPLFTGQLDGDFVGGGLLVTKDFADISYQYTQVGVSGSYSKLLNKNPYQYLTFGTQVAYTQRTFLAEDHLFGTFYTNNGVSFDPAVDIGAASISYIDLSAGVLWFSALDKHSDIFAGLGLFHPNRPSVSFLPGRNQKLFMKTAIHAGGTFALDGMFSVVPHVLILSQGPSFESNMGAYLKLELSREKSNGFAFYLGPWFRMAGNESSPLGSDAFIVSTRVDIAGISIGYSYDVNVSSLNVISRGKGGNELSLIYVGTLTGMGPGGGRGGSLNCPRF